MSFQMHSDTLMNFVCKRENPGASGSRITFDDNGPGIPEDKREDVFKPFLRLDEARNLDESGTGLGIVHRARHCPQPWR